jgi:hypothetical protein
MAPRKRIKTTATTTAPANPPDGGYAPEADFDDTIAKNRVLPVLSAASIPSPPNGYRPTNPDTRGRRLRPLAADLVSEAGDALRAIEGRDLKADLGKYAPDGSRAPALLARMKQTSDLVTSVQSLLTYAKELDQIARSDALRFLESVNKSLGDAVDHDPTLATKYMAVQKLFTARSEAIAEGMVRSKEQVAADKAAADKATTDNTPAK